MANNMTWYLENQLANYIFRDQASFAKPVNLAIALCGNVPSGDKTAGNCTELPNANGYARQALTPSGLNWSMNTGTSGLVWNNVAFTWSQASGPWGWASGAMLCDSATYGAGNGIAWGALTNPRDVQNTDQFTVPASSVSFQFD